MKPFIGRQDEVARAESILQSTASSGSGAVVVLTGAAGIGKTSTAAAIADAATNRFGFQVLSGRAHVLPTDLAYAPVIEAFGRALRKVDGYSRTQLTRGLPDLGLLFPDLGAEPPPDLGDPGLARYSFAALKELRAELSR